MALKHYSFGYSASLSSWSWVAAENFTICLPKPTSPAPRPLLSLPHHNRSNSIALNNSDDGLARKFFQF